MDHATPWGEKNPNARQKKYNESLIPAIFSPGRLGLLTFSKSAENIQPCAQPTPAPMAR